MVWTGPALPCVQVVLGFSLDVSKAASLDFSFLFGCLLDDGCMAVFYWVVVVFNSPLCLFSTVSWLFSLVSVCGCFA